MKNRVWKTFKEERPPENSEIFVRKKDDVRETIVFGRISFNCVISHATGPGNGFVYMSFIPLPSDEWTYASIQGE